MNKLENLQQITDRALDGLRADEALKTRILKKALQEEKPCAASGSFRFVPVLLTSVALMILCIFLLNGKKPLVPDEDQHLIYSFSAGSGEYDPKVSFDVFCDMEPSLVESMEILSEGKVTSHEQIDRLMEALKEQSESVQDADVVMNDRLEICGSSGQIFSFPAGSPYIGWSDGIRKCESFFEMFKSPDD